MVFEVVTRVLFQHEYYDFHKALDNTDCFSFTVEYPDVNRKMIKGKHTNYMVIVASFRDPRIAARFDQVWG